jgi:hypothetical protein
MPSMRRVLGWAAAGLGLSAGAYLTCVAYAYSRYGRAPALRPDEEDTLLDHFMPDYDVAERHSVDIAAPPAITLATAANAGLMASPLVRTIVRAREIVLGATPDSARRPRGLLDEMTALGWRVLAGIPDREIVVGAVTQPWHANVVFRGLPPEEFAGFDEPGYVKIAWTLRADPVADGTSIFRTETRVVTTDAAARRLFRWYWARFSPGIILIRRELVRRLKRDAERRARGLVEDAWRLPLQSATFDGLKTR